MAAPTRRVGRFDFIVAAVVHRFYQESGAADCMFALKLFRSDGGKFKGRGQEQFAVSIQCRPLTREGSNCHAFAASWRLSDANPACE